METSMIATRHGKETLLTWWRCHCHREVSMKPTPRTLGIAAAAVAFGLVVAGRMPPSFAAGDGPAQNLLAGHDWAHLTGATVAGNAVHITPAARMIVNQDGTGGQP